MGKRNKSLAFLVIAQLSVADAGILTCLKLLIPSYIKEQKTYPLKNIPKQVVDKLERKLHFLQDESNEKTFVSQSDSFLVPLDKFLGENLLSKQQPRFEIEELLGAGGQGAVFHAFDNLEQREVAIKVSEEHENGPAAIALSRKLERKLKDKNPLLTIFDYQVKDKWALTVSEWVPDKNYTHYKRSRSPFMTPDGILFFQYTPQNIIEHLTIMRNLSKALQIIHKNEFLFTDLKAENVAVFGDLQVKLLDLDSLSPIEEHGGVSVDTMPLITPGLESPEMTVLWEARDRAKNVKEKLARSVGPQSDAYSFGDILQKLVNDLNKNNFKSDPLVKATSDRILKELVFPLKEKIPEQRMSLEEAEQKLNLIIASVQENSKKSLKNP